jgi:hypothetical protein
VPTGSRRKDLLGGILMLLLGVGALVEGRRYPLGTLSHMGPGFFPIALGAALVAIGALIGIAATFAAPRRPETSLPREWRGWACITAGVVAFGILGRYGGLVPATFAIVFISALGDRQNSVKSAIALALLMVVFCIVVFSLALRIQLDLFAWG